MTAVTARASAMVEPAPRSRAVADARRGKVATQRLAPVPMVVTGPIRRRVPRSEQTRRSDLASAQEAERRRIGRELHDVVGQALTAVKLCLQTESLSRRPARRRELSDAMATVEQALQEIRDFAITLRPPILDDFGLVAALRWHLDREARRSGFQVSLVVDPIDERLTPEIEIACFRIVQEALSNVARHAHASRVEIALRVRSETLHLRIRDNGEGFRASDVRRQGNSEHLGLIGMRERASLVGGTLRLASSPVGTTVWARLPMPRPSRVT